MGNKTRYFSTLVVLFSVVLSVAVGEIVLRTFFAEQLVYYPWLQHDRTLTFRYDQELGWFPIPDSEKTFTGSRAIKVQHNHMGFRDPEHVLDSKPRMVFLGDSFLWGYDVEQSERLTERLREMIPNWSIFNLGVSGYGTDQEYLLLQKYFDHYQPDIVFLLFCVDNDMQDNTHNVSNGGYYKPYYKLEAGAIVARGIPVPKSANYFFGTYPTVTESYVVRAVVKAYYRRKAPPAKTVTNLTFRLLTEMQQFVQQRNGQFVVGLQNRNPYLSAFLQRNGIPFVELSNPYRYREQGGHWTPTGHRYVSRKIHEFLIKGNYLN